jgi:excisionase family DNA binding protein
MLHIGRDKVYYLLRTGQLRSLKIGKLRRITEQQLAEFIGRNVAALVKAEFEKP